MGDTVLYERDGHVATITYNRPEALNAINADLRNDLNAARGTAAGRQLYPSGFVFHESRVGSTLVANILGSDPMNMIFSER